MQLQSDEMGPLFIFQWKSRSGGRGGVGGSPNHRFEIRIIFQKSGLGGSGRGVFQEQWASKLQIQIQPLQWGRNKHWTKTWRYTFFSTTRPITRRIDPPTCRCSEHKYWENKSFLADQRRFPDSYKYVGATKSKHKTQIFNNRYGHYNLNRINLVKRIRLII